jgi:hypothetical protein
VYLNRFIVSQFIPRANKSGKWPYWIWRCHGKARLKNKMKEEEQGGEEDQ